jgi:hypothetical protein
MGFSARRRLMLSLLHVVGDGRHVTCETQRANTRALFKIRKVVRRAWVRIARPCDRKIRREQSFPRLLNAYQKYYNEARTHLSLRKDAPIPRAVQTVGHTVAVPILGGLHHQYIRA